MPLVKRYKVAGQEQGLGLRSVVKWKISASRFLHAGSIALSGTLQVTSENFMHSAWCKSSLCFKIVQIVFENWLKRYRRLWLKENTALKCLEMFQFSLSAKKDVFSYYSLSLGSQRMPHKLWSPWIKHFQLKQSVDLSCLWFLCVPYFSDSKHG